MAPPLISMLPTSFYRQSTSTRQTTIQQIGEQGQLFGFHIGEALGCGHEAGSEITAWFGKREGLDRVLRE